MGAPASSPPSVSVVVIAYRQPRLLNEALDSVRRQTFRDYELIAVDDDSGDECVGRYELPPGARMIRHPRRRAAAAATRNTGIRASRGRYVAFLDQDDAWLPEKLEAQVQMLEARPDAALVFCGHVATDERLVPLKRQPPAARLPADPVRALIRRNIITTPSSVLVRRSALDRCGLFDETIAGASDRDLWLRLAVRHPLMALPRGLTLYRMHPGQLHLREPYTRPGRLRFQEKTLAWAESERPDLVPDVRRSFARLLRRIAVILMRREGRAREALEALERSRRLEPRSARGRLLALEARLRCRLQ